MSEKTEALTIDQILEKAADIKNFECRDGGTPESEITELEKELNIHLPNDYRHFLSNYGFVGWFGDSVEGLAEKGTIDYRLGHVLKTTLSYQEKYSTPEYQSLPNQGVVINRYAGGGYYFLFSKESERAGEVGLFLTETFGQEVSVYDNFTDFLLYLVAKDADEVHPELEALVKEPSLVEVDYSFLDNIK
ncbi:SMI1/KNR4 family protein [Agarivorans sp. 1_MG-2023]|uniref:SMI1/KNR4 family protein n=1 Tax=Agarivorans sp. 1_MG-2023 TaxID=3062634 RepID=UPI0026E1159F|nr:SMI1/KNR4 family protein [Agarivorans sp. 1_MG-2023]MDO6764917.1 SMI1/KNR4 family protein [Agarivorans sp. 1_MG-2023]